MIYECYEKSKHFDRLPFYIENEETVVYVRLGYDQYWKNPKGGWDKTDYNEIIQTIDKLSK